MLFTAHFTILYITEVISALNSWPRGTYGIPEPESGCPQPTWMWEKGARVQITEHGSVSSDNSHLAGSSEIETDTVIQQFCVKTVADADRNESESDFMPGSYCILKKRECPDEFRTGSIYWDDAAPFIGRTSQSSSGTLPDGEYNRNTKILFCCRADGSADNAIYLPTSSPFYLLKLGERCQKVSNMDVSEEWMLWIDEKSVNLNRESGLYPEIIRQRGYTFTTKLFYCYYAPKSSHSIEWHVGLDINRKDAYSLREIIVIAAYIIGGTVGLVLIIAIILTAIQRALLLRQARHNQRDRDTGSRRHLMREHTGSRTQPPQRSMADLPPAYDVVVSADARRGSEILRRNERSATSGSVCSTAVSSQSSQLLTTDDVIRPPSYDDVLHSKPPDS